MTELILLYATESCEVTCARFYFSQARQRLRPFPTAAAEFRYSASILSGIRIVRFDALYSHQLESITPSHELTADICEPI